MPDPERARHLARLADLIEHRLAPALERIAGALERAPTPAAGVPPAAPARPGAGARTAEALRAQLLAARDANDPERLIELRDELAGLLDEGPRAELDRQAIGWLMALIQRRLRIAPMPPDVPALAEAVAGRFAATPEGASLRKALPTLRRSAGLCPRCARPYRGIAEACPECLAAPPPVPPENPPGPDVPDETGGAVGPPADAEADADGA